ncbi:orotate phosphoribosyltransferase [Pisciglobus halotolerans]|uniref:Orotate phosphoribosyltransferase n=1 Tax=Pisciglobus halotolerans TaxID=745365 RepID=A0A1I3DW46_9LACT|nr:orotate phosphoribosyltransferase [Pisciglobus halotolerans]SFH90905.1 orotate phosphoribosyltransferase [Pisciglobus halotolerans]
MKQEKKYADLLLDCEAVSLSPKKPYTWASGIKSPIYCDNRITMSYPTIRKEIAKGLAALIRQFYPGVEVIAGTATAGIPHAAWVAEILDLPMIYVRSKAKGHGKQNQIEGRLQNGQKVVCIEDLISTGGSVIEAAAAVQQAGGEVLGCVAIFSYQLDAAATNFEKAELALHTLSHYTALMEQAAEKAIITSEEKALLAEWRKDPSKW